MISFTYEILLCKKVRLTRGYIAPIWGSIRTPYVRGTGPHILWGLHHRMLLPFFFLPIAHRLTPPALQHRNNKHRHDRISIPKRRDSHRTMMSAPFRWMPRRKQRDQRRRCRHRRRAGHASIRPGPPPHGYQMGPRVTPRKT